MWDLRGKEWVATTVVISQGLVTWVSRTCSWQEELAIEWGPQGAAGTCPAPLFGMVSKLSR